MEARILRLHLQQFVAAAGTIRLQRFGRLCTAPHTLCLMNEGTRGKKRLGLDSGPQPNVADSTTSGAHA